VARRRYDPAIEFASRRVSFSQSQPLSASEAKAFASVLVVENHDEMRAALCDWLLSSLPPLRLLEARSMEEALQHAAHAKLDLVLMNLELPGANGIEATRELRRRHPSCPVVIMSVNASEALRVAAIEAGALAFVSKRELPHGLLPILGGLGK
jgi:DNA-binding NarL/FixJ family response regulator